jgi:hypothetical protein
MKLHEMRLAIYIHERQRWWRDRISSVLSLNLLSGAVNLYNSTFFCGWTISNFRLWMKSLHFNLYAIPIASVMVHKRFSLSGQRLHGACRCRQGGTALNWILWPLVIYLFSVDCSVACLLAGWLDHHKPCAILKWERWTGTWIED